jgi:DeoR/GlpR family transcriptional regulator of sugar metabolism
MTYHQEQDIVLVKRAMLDAAARTVLLMDSSKAPRRALHQLRPLDAFDELVVDDGVGDELLAEMREHVSVTVAPR